MMGLEILLIYNSTVLRFYFMTEDSSSRSVFLHFSKQELYLYVNCLEKSCLEVLPKWSPSELTCLKEALARLNLHRSLKKQSSALTIFPRV